MGNWFGTRRNTSEEEWPGNYAHEDRYRADYVSLYVDTVGAAVGREAPHVQYLSSTPTDGLYTEEVWGHPLGTR